MPDEKEFKKWKDAVEKEFKSVKGKLSLVEKMLKDTKQLDEDVMKEVLGILSEFRETKNEHKNWQLATMFLFGGIASVALLIIIALITTQ